MFTYNVEVWTFTETGGKFVGHVVGLDLARSIVTLRNIKGETEEFPTSGVMNIRELYGIKTRGTTNAQQQRQEGTSARPVLHRGGTRQRGTAEGLSRPA